jgi:hypothetical protein
MTDLGIHGIGTRPDQGQLWPSMIRRTGQRSELFERIWSIVEEDLPPTSA